MSYNKLKALEGNIEAISTALAIHEKRRNATTAERETLSKFTGCGGIKEVLSIGTGTPIPDTMQEAVKRLLSVWKIQCKLPPKTKRFCPLVLK